VLIKDNICTYRERNSGNAKSQTKGF